MELEWKKGPTKLIIWAAVILLVIACLGVAATLASGKGPPEFMLPLLIISGVMMLLVTLALTAFVFSGVDLTDKTQALGLPEGSVRSVIALSLVLLFAILAVYLYSSMASRGKIFEAKGLTKEASAQLKERLLPGQFVLEQQVGDGTNATVTVQYRDTQNPASDDFAKQLLAIIGTLVTAVSSFYFGSKTAIASQSSPDKPGGIPVIRSINPSKVRRGVLTKLEITGDGLDTVKEVKAVSNDRQVLATDVTSSASGVKCSLAMDLSAPTGAWDIVVSDGTGKTAKLSGGLFVES
ncbi:hypothetical protein I3J27_29015 [Bradyrhizobium xenonodulans]|uniref:Uncharacterized protein n=1 Tax=Bradyrhizobium xenonodulans TaxID=2736875 RepID=A0ABY7MHJ0_9BRAD|nr:hypothetical protein [Bradyrhizobium xenonodulans]WBL77036.1 hypothetical protein I3J27_29015 [Bradyrhizobium xenonodulans]